MSRSVVESCAGCGADGLEPVLERRGTPVYGSMLMPTRAAARAVALDDIRLALCPACGLIQNTAFEPERLSYGAAYDGSQAHSPSFAAFAEALARDLIDRHGLRGKDIVEIGCGDGSFLTLLCRLGGNRGVGIDPAVPPEAETAAGGAAVRFLRELYGPAHRALPADLVCCRHTLEHIKPVRAFVDLVRDCAPPGAAVFFEVPDTDRILAETAFWDVYYEHCGYFTAGSLGRLFHAAGFRLQRVHKGFGGQYLLLEATLDGAHGIEPARDLPALRTAVAAFRGRLDTQLEQWRARLALAHRRGEHVALWGGGSKAVGFFATLDGAPEIGCVVDINPRRQGMFVPGTGHPIVAPAFLSNHRPDLVVVANPIYRDEIAGALAAMGLTPELRCL